MSSINGPKAGNHSQKMPGMRDIQLVLARWGFGRDIARGWIIHLLPLASKGFCPIPLKVKPPAVMMMA